MSFTFDGGPIDVPPSAVAWQVRRPVTRGRAEAVCTTAGQPLFLPISAGIEDLRRAVEIDGRYELVPVDEHHRRIAGSASAWVWLRSDP